MGGGWGGGLAWESTSLPVETLLFLGNSLAMGRPGTIAVIEISRDETNRTLLQQ